MSPVIPMAAAWRMQGGGQLLITRPRHQATRPRRAAAGRCCSHLETGIDLGRPRTFGQGIKS
ncbi:hypothetical protein GGTG_05799 [Gaeumannomyces tritici R3-111a-1]|uniref:Uncharacterized protein n=1 Tax=Gaeumannomyces tritici (strain R3-111a-1) TaxID=644352 RepID=J3NWY8_GAET3|nr:hypothetical protein GGTG_05799 [Gaeumannomyces tritici R3-111a-1]EJT75870.1 hypothetical protein GGTG_05799 [Gaeumannomyces tritici R3-111a-1]